MSIRFKFRSSVNFDTVEFENRVSISVGELRAKILHGKNSQQQQQKQGFDLVFSDAVTGLEYMGDDSQIPSGSCVIVKRIPCGTEQFVACTPKVANDVRVKDLNTGSPAIGPMDEFDDIGVDLCPMPDSELPQFDLEIDTNNFIDSKKEDVAGLSLECRTLNSGDVTPGCDQTCNEKNILQETIVVGPMKTNKLSTSNLMAVQTSNLPLELKCSLCTNFFKEAVMIPCCQHSFCDKCIRLVLIEKGRCPKCFSSKCNVEDLLPNLSLRQAIEHFLQSQMLDADLDKGMEKYVPDGESGIQAKDISCALTVVQRELEQPQSSCATGSGCNPVLMESYSDQHHRPAADFQGENQPLIVPQANTQDEAEFNSNKGGRVWLDTGVSHRNFSAFGGYKKGVRHCYVCGSPDHLMRDCPASYPNPMFQPGNGTFQGGMPGYAPAYWNGSSLPPFRPYANVYGNPTGGMMPFNASFPVSPFAVPPYIPSICSGLPGPRGDMKATPQFEYFGLQYCENSSKHSNDDVTRQRTKSHYYEPEKHKEQSSSRSGDGFTQRSWRDSQHINSDSYVDEKHEKSPHSSFAVRGERRHADRSNSGVGETPNISDQCSERMRKHHHGESNNYHHERRERHDSDSSLANHSTRKYVRRMVDSNSRGSHEKHHRYSESSLELRSPVERGRGYKESNTGHESRPSRRSEKHSRDKRHVNRWEMFSGSNEDCRDHKHRDHKRRRAY